MLEAVSVLLNTRVLYLRAVGLMSTVIKRSPSAAGSPWGQLASSGQGQTVESASCQGCERFGASHTEFSSTDTAVRDQRQESGSSSSSFTKLLLANVKLSRVGGLCCPCPYEQAQVFYTTQPTSFLGWTLKHGTVTNTMGLGDIPFLFTSSEVTKRSPYALTFFLPR